MNLIDRLEAARTIASRKAPSYFRAALHGATFVLSNEVPTFAIDESWRVYVNPAFAADMTDLERAGCVLHEVLHPTLEHGKRCCGRDHERWNRAGDREINPKVVRGNRLALPSGCLLPADLNLPDTLTAEEYYRADAGKAGESKCSGGSGAGKPGPWEKPDAKGGVSKAKATSIRKQVAHEIQATEARKPGSVPAHWLRWAEELIAPPRIPWELSLGGHLRAGVFSRVGPKPSYARPSRRLVGGGLVLPVHRAPRPRIAIVGDTSASMSTQDMGKVLGTIRDTCLTVGRVWAIACDSSATQPVEVGSVDELRDYWKGGGGTDLRIGMRAAEAVMPDVLCVVTDGETPWPNEAPAFPVIVVLTKDSKYETPPSWATVVKAFDK